MYRSPGGPPRRPASPSPRQRGSARLRRRPPEFSHGFCAAASPCPCRGRRRSCRGRSGRRRRRPDRVRRLTMRPNGVFCTISCWPVPRQTEHVSGFVPGLAPLPWQVSQVSVRGIVMSVSMPKTASLNSMVIVYCRSLPRCGAFGSRRGCRRRRTCRRYRRNRRNPAAVRNRRRRSPGSGRCGRTVVMGPLLLVAEHVIGFLDFLEPLLRIRRFVDIRMILAGQLAVSLLDLLRGGVPADAQHFVVVPFLRHSATPSNWINAARDSCITEGQSRLDRL